MRESRSDVRGEDARWCGNHLRGFHALPDSEIYTTEYISVLQFNEGDTNLSVFVHHSITEGALPCTTKRERERPSASAFLRMFVVNY